ncbi:MAG: hypothetical protein LBS64_04400 [Spirochaetaceae bacterium]|jgi:hypothetical protein|nr:hypothetical protein [Spirochaetaceae bacterium]
MNLSLVLCFVPSVAVGMVCALRKTLRWQEVLLAAATGLVVFVPIILLQFLTGGLPLFKSRALISVLFRALVFNGVIEETIKMLGIALLGAGRKKSLAAGTAQAAVAGLVLGGFETAAYFIAGYRNILLRLCTAVVIHCEGAVLSSFSVRSGAVGRRCWRSFVLAILIHGVYNFFAGFAPPIRWFSVAAILLGALECRIAYRKLAGKDAEP